MIALHGVFATYGFWPPNDPRGSWSDRVWAEHLKRFGEAKKVSTRRSIARQPFDRELRREIDQALKYPKVWLDARQRIIVAEAIGEIVKTLHLQVYAFAVMPDHTHFVSARHREDIETIVGFFKRAVSRALAREAMHPMGRYQFEDGSFPWVRGGWKRFLNTSAEIAGAIEYVRANPERANLPPQRHDFETPFVWYRGGGSRARDRETRTISENRPSADRLARLAVAATPLLPKLARMHSKLPPRNRLAKVLPEEWRKMLVSRGVPKRKYTAVCRATLAGGRVVDEMIVEEGWIIATSRAGLAGTFEQRIDFDPRQITDVELINFV